MDIAQQIRSHLASLPGAKVSGKGQGGEMKITIAEQKSFLSKKSVEYSARFKVLEDERTVAFFEMLKESGSGMSGGDSSDFGGGWGVSKETYKTGTGGREGGIEVQGSLLGKKYSFTFDYGRLRSQIQTMAEQSGYRFDYRLTPKGL